MLSTIAVAVNPRRMFARFAIRARHTIVSSVGVIALMATPAAAQTKGNDCDLLRGRTEKVKKSMERMLDCRERDRQAAELASMGMGCPDRDKLEAEWTAVQLRVTPCVPPRKPDPVKPPPKPDPTRPRDPEESGTPPSRPLVPTSADAMSVEQKYAAVLDECVKATCGEQAELEGKWVLAFTAHIRLLVEEGKTQVAREKLYTVKMKAGVPVLLKAIEDAQLEPSEIEKLAGVLTEDLSKPGTSTKAIRERTLERLRLMGFLNDEKVLAAWLAALESMSDEKDANLQAFKTELRQSKPDPEKLVILTDRLAEKHREALGALGDAVHEPPKLVEQVLIFRREPPRSTGECSLDWFGLEFDAAIQTAPAGVRSYLIDGPDGELEQTLKEAHCACSNGWNARVCSRRTSEWSKHDRTNDLQSAPCIGVLGIDFSEDKGTRYARAIAWKARASEGTKRTSSEGYPVCTAAAADSAAQAQKLAALKFTPVVKDLMKPWTRSVHDPGPSPPPPPLPPTRLDAGQAGWRAAVFSGLPWFDDRLSNDTTGWIATALEVGVIVTGSVLLSQGISMRGEASTAAPAARDQMLKDAERRTELGANVLFIGIPVTRLISWAGYQVGAEAFP